MGYLRKRDNGAVTDWLAGDSVEYQTLKAVRFASQVNAAAGPATGGIISGETPGVIAAGQPMWEDIAEEDAGFPDPTGGRVGVLLLGSAALASAETTSEEFNAEVAGSLTDVEYVSAPNGVGITGVNTNNRVLTLNQVVVTGTSSPARAVNALAAITFSVGVNAVPGVPVALTVSTAAFAAGAPLQVVSSVNGTGIADPGGLLYFVYTRS